MKKLIMAVCLSGLALPVFASYGGYRANNNGYGNSYTGSTHNVRPYYRNDGTYIEGHRAGNPGSGVHCHDNYCY